MKPKVIIILNRLVIGGQAIDTIPLAYYLQEYFDILLLYGEKEADEVEASFLLYQYPGLQIKKISQLRRTINPLTDVLAFFKLVAIIKKHKATVVHTHGSKSGLLGRLAAKWCRVPNIIHTFHGHLFHSYFNSFFSKLLQWLEKKLAAISTHIIALSEMQKQELVNTYKIASSNKIKVIPLGIDPSIYTLIDNEKRENFRKKFHLQPNDVAIGIIGRVVPIKNHQLYLEIAKEMLFNKKYEHVYFFVIGDGGEMETLMQQLSQKNIPFYPAHTTAKIVFTSWVEDMLWAYYGLDIIVLTSLNEGTPLSIIEAQFCGKPVIAANVGGVKDTFKNEVSGYLVNGSTKEDYLPYLEKLINNEEERIEMGKQAKLFANITFAKQQEVALIKNLYLNPNYN